MILLENTQIIKNPIVESTKDGFLRMRGIMMQSEIQNKNGRVYPRGILEAAVEEFELSGKGVMGELEHPETLTINLERVSHIVEKLWMDGDDVLGEIKILNTPCGSIVRNLVEGGAEVGVSSRGGGDVIREGDVDKVTDFSFVTLDFVGSPSAPAAMPQAISESIKESHMKFINSVKAPESQEIIKRMIINSIVKGL